MSGSHSHDPKAERAKPKGPLSGRIKAMLALMLMPLIAATAVGGILLWPDDQRHETPSQLGPQAELLGGKVVDVEVGLCENDPSSNTCNNTEIELKEGPEAGQTTTLSFPQGPGQPDIREGDDLIVGRTTDVSGATTYYFSDYERRPFLGYLAGAFAVLVVLVARWRGLGAIAGLLLTWGVLTQFMLPSILEGNSPVLVALTGSAAVVFLALYVAHGFSSATTTAVLGTLISLGITGVLAKFAVDATRLSGFASEETTFVQTYAGTIDIQGLILGGIILGALGVLNDVTVTQSSAVREIHAAQPNLSRLQLYKSGMRVGRDHIASTVYTLVLAYTGAALPLLILFTLANRGFADVVGTELVAEEVIRTLIGSLGLILCVPITTGLAAIVERSRRRPDADPALVEAGSTPKPPDTGQVETDTADVSSTAGLDTEMPETSEDAIRKEVPVERRFRDMPVPFERRMSRRERKFWEND